MCYSEAGLQWQGYLNRTIADNETGDVKNRCKSHQPQNWDRSEKVWWRQHTGLGDCTVLDKSPTASVFTKVKWLLPAKWHLAVQMEIYNKQYPVVMDIQLFAQLIFLGCTLADINRNRRKFCHNLGQGAMQMMWQSIRNVGTCSRSKYVVC